MDGWIDIERAGVGSVRKRIGDQGNDAAFKGNERQQLYLQARGKSP